MKFWIALTVLVFGCATQIAQAQWVAQQSGTTLTLNKVHFVNASVGWVAGEAGIIRNTTDGGSAWTPQSSGTTGDILSLCFTSATRGYAMTGDAILKTTDGGSTWTQGWAVSALGLSGNYMRALSCADSSHIYAGGGSRSASQTTRVLVKTTDAGANWSDTSNQQFAITAMHFIAPNEGYIIGDDIYPQSLGHDIPTNSVGKTTNGGVSWTRTFTFWTNETLFSLYFTDANNSHAGGSTSNLRRTTNTGSTWTSKTLGSNPFQTRSIQFVNSNTGWAVGTPYIAKTSDGGVNWGTQNNPVSVDLHSVYFIDENTGWIVGAQGTILKTVNAGGLITGIVPMPSDTRRLRSSESLPYFLATPGRVQAKVFNGRGALLLNLLDQTMPAGDHVLDLSGMELPSGAHFLEIRTPAFRESVKLPAR
jgi:photosystem II stability/assembly factor-like uncharacterized protein